MPTPTRRALRRASLTFVALSILAAMTGAARNIAIGNPIGFAINITTILFLAAGVVAIWLDRPRPSI